MVSRLIGGLEMTCRVLANEELLDAQAQVLAEDAIETSAIDEEIASHITRGRHETQHNHILDYFGDYSTSRELELQK
jgi:hypothetical protein